MLRFFFSSLRGAGQAGGLDPEPPPEDAEFDPGQDDTVGTPSGTYTTGTFTYASSIDGAITNLFARYSHDDDLTNLPILVIMHGYNQEVSDFEVGVFDRFASYKFFAVGVGMRARDGAGGSKDSSGREIQDIIDAVEYIRTNFAAVVDPDKVAIVGYSGGGGNVYAACTKFPDFFAVATAFFGMSDYGEDPVYGWYYTDPGFQSDINGQIGGSPITYPERYIARNALAAITNYRGYLYIFHDAGDAAVDVTHSRRVNTALLTEGAMRHEYSETAGGVSPRWRHALPNTGAEVIQAEPIFNDLARNAMPVTMKNTATVRVNGYMVTKDFSIWLGTGIDEAATVQYNLTTRTYIVTPLTGSMDVEIIQGAYSDSRTITAEETIVLS